MGPSLPPGLLKQELDEEEEGKHKVPTPPQGNTAEPSIHPSPQTAEPPQESSSPGQDLGHGPGTAPAKAWARSQPQEHGETEPRGAPSRDRVSRASNWEPIQVILRRDRIAGQFSLCVM